MTPAQIDLLCKSMQPCKLVETHISWVLLTPCFAFKVKKPVAFSFINTISLEARKEYCEKEIFLNTRLTDDVYIGVVTIRDSGYGLMLGEGEGDVIDYAVKMHRLPENKRMDRLLSQDEVTNTDIIRLARKIAGFHQRAEIIYPRNITRLQAEFNDIRNYADLLNNLVGAPFNSRLDAAIRIADRFFSVTVPRISKRVAEGFFRDGHGDLHTGNIFLLPAPEPFDCIEFNDSLRYIDVLNDIAFTCMDLDAKGRQDLSDLFVNTYQNVFPVILDAMDEQLFIYYKAYRANIRAKITCVSAQAVNAQENRDMLRQSAHYFMLMEEYLSKLC